MAMTISGSNGVTYPDGTSQASGSQACKAWVNFNGTGTVAITASYNVSSITDNGTGYYGVNFTTAMSDANYAAATQGNQANSAASWGYTGFERGVRSASQYVVQFSSTNSYTVADVEIATVAIFR